MDIRDRSFVSHHDVTALNFIQSTAPYYFRRHFKNGLRSHIMEVLLSADVENESKGVVIDGLKWFPTAQPLKMLRIFRRKFQSLNEAFNEIKRLRIIEKYLDPQHIAKSIEFITEYQMNNHSELVLCGLQEFVLGEALDPWHLPRMADIPGIIDAINADPLQPPGRSPHEFTQIVNKDVGSFVKEVKTLIFETGYVPDLAGRGNLLLTRTGHIKLVDINNIIHIRLNGPIPLDDIGYPVCDKSIEALYLLERHFFNQLPNAEDPVYQSILTPQRMKEVSELEQSFQESVSLKR